MRVVTHILSHQHSHIHSLPANPLPSHQTSHPIKSNMPNQITLYTAHHCPFAHRVQIILRELSLEFKTCLVDITIPRTPEYLAINPNGMVPALVYNDLVLTESSLICQFLADSHPSHLLFPSSDPKGALQRFKIGYFVDTYSSKAHKLFDSTVFAHDAEAKIEMANKYVDAVVEYVEPLLADSGPFFGGSDRLTLAEVSQSLVHARISRQ
jgi:glutathione S-transferase